MRCLLALLILLAPLSAEAGRELRALHKGLHAAIDDPSKPPPSAMFSEEELTRLEAGEVLFTYDRIRGHDLLMATTIATASPEAVWERIVELPSYPVFIPMVAEASLDHRSQQDDRLQYRGTLELEVPGLPAKLTLESERRIGSGYMTYHLASGFRNPFRHMVGYWSVVPFQPGTVLVQLQMDLALDFPLSKDKRRENAERILPELLMGLTLLAEGRL